MTNRRPLLLLIALLLLGWDLLVRLNVVGAYLLPPPAQVLQAFQDLGPELWQAGLQTLSSATLGFLGSAISGFILALILSRFSALKQAVLPVAVFFQTVPIVAIAPLLVIWFGFGAPTVRVSALIVSFFPLLANALVGLGQSDPQLRELFRVYGASPRQILFQLQIPSSLAYLNAGLKVASGLAVVGAIVGEFVAGGGLGGLIDSARTQQRVDIVFAALFLSALIGFFYMALIRWGFGLLLRHRPYFNKDSL
ncbi:MAG: ABC transporter permease [Bdellovibrio sp. CG10_big_fil_rev_8_21_14_0_10_47_8]|nr:MAG: ABC transporter permease [Bdellovibrio sp. CG10_big_fil_rev_8_21_14_0_10_47_8]